MSWRNVLLRVKEDVYQTEGGDLIQRGGDLCAEYAKCSAATERCELVDALFQTVDFPNESNKIKERIVFVVMHFLKCRLRRSEFDVENVSHVPRSIDDEFSKQREQLVGLEKATINGQLEKSALTESYDGFVNILHMIMADNLKKKFVECFGENALNPYVQPLTEVVGTMAARIDIAGGWTDTPPITFEMPNGVVNLAVKVKGKKPITCTVRKTYGNLKESIIIRSRQEPDEMCCYSEVKQITDCSTDPKMFGSLICASFRAMGHIDKVKTYRELFDVLFPNEKVMGLRVVTSSDLPQGSGLGVSSIISACFLATLFKLLNIDFDRQRINALVLKAEQILTTGGGWQDQIGGMYPGLKYAQLIGTEVQVRHIPLSKAFAEEIEQKLVLIYTGQSRLASNVLHKVVHKYIGGHGEFLRDIELLSENAKIVFDTLCNSEFPIKQCKRYSELKSRMAHNALPLNVEDIFEILEHKKIIEAGWICGAGGGGFACVWLTDTFSNIRKELYHVVEHWNSEASIHTIEIDEDPFEITLCK